MCILKYRKRSEVHIKQCMRERGRVFLVKSALYFSSNVADRTYSGLDFKKRMNNSAIDAKQVARGRNWSDSETRIFIRVLQENFSHLQGSKCF